MTILHGDDRFYNNIFVQKGAADAKVVMHDHDEGTDSENREVGTFVFDDYPTYDEWNAQFDFSKPADMGALEKVHFGHLPIWSEGNVYLGGAKPFKKEKDAIVKDVPVSVELSEENGSPILKTNVFDLIKEIRVKGVNTDTLGKAFEPDQPFENNDGTPIVFNKDYFDDLRAEDVLPGPFASTDIKTLF